MDKNDSAWALTFGLACFAGAGAILLYNLIAPTWDNGKTNALVALCGIVPLSLVVLGGIFLGLDWRDKRQAERREQATTKRQHSIDRQTQDAQAFGANAFVMRQTLDLLGQVAQVQARQATAGLADLKREVFQQRAIEPPTQEPSWFVGEWDYGTEEAENVEATGGVRYL